MAAVSKDKIQEEEKKKRKDFFQNGGNNRIMKYSVSVCFKIVLRLYFNMLRIGASE